MAVEELLRPRYKVIERWPDMGRDAYYQGEIIILKAFDQKQWSVKRGPCTLYDAFFDSYPHLFKKLEWWEERKIEELPKYVKSKRTGVVYGLVLDYIKKSMWLDSCELTLNLSAYAPTTREEYNQYTNKQKEATDDKNT